MIGQLRGILLEKQAPDLVVDVQGVGYELQAPMSTFYKLPPVGEAVLLYTHFVVREDAQLLFGFTEKGERRLFRALIRVNKVGPKLALAILSGMDVGQFVTCVQRNDTASLVRLPGVGQTTADRLLLDMRNRLKEWHVEPNPAASGILDAASPRDILEDAENALIALGYKPQQASRAIAGVASDDVTTSENLIRLALRSLLPGERKTG